MEKSDKQERKNNKFTEVKTFPVQFPLEENQEKITFKTNTPSKPSKEQIINQAFKFHSQGNISEAAKYYQYFINRGFQDYRVFSNFGIILQNLERLEEAELSLRKAIELKPDFAEAHTNLGTLLKELGSLREAELSLRKAIELKPDFALAHFNFGTVLTSLGKLEEAEVSTRKAIELNPNFAEAHSNLGNILNDLGKSKEAETSIRKAINLKPDYSDAHYNLGVILKDLGKLKEAEVSLRKAIKFNHNWEADFLYASLLFDRKEFALSLNSLEKAKSLVPKSNLATVEAAIKAIDLNSKNYIRENQLNSLKFSVNSKEKELNRIILNLPVNSKLLSYLYDIKTRRLNNTNSKDARYGEGLCSDFNLFEDNSQIIRELEIDLKNLVKKSLRKKEIIIQDSFFNIFVSGSGATPHNHSGPQDKNFGLSHHKYSLVYYLEVGDQTSKNPGILKLYNPNEQILPKNGMVIIINSEEFHSVSYIGNKDRVMIGINFYCF